MFTDLITWMVEIGGFAGICLGFAYIYIRRLHDDLLESQAARNADKDAMIQKLLDLSNKWNETINAQIEAQEALKVLFTEVRKSNPPPAPTISVVPATPIDHQLKP